MATHPAASKFVLPILCLLVASASVQSQDDRRLTGRLTDPASAPLEGVSVLLISVDRAFQTKSGTAGGFRFEDVPSGLYELELSRPGFIKLTIPVDFTTKGSQSPAIVLKVGSIPDMNYCGPHSSIVYQTPGAMKPRLHGIIQDYYGRSPVSNAKVTVWRAGEQVSMRRSDRGGKFAFDDLPAGHYDLLISRSGYAKAEVKALLLPRENGASIEIPILKRNQIVICQ